MFVIFIKQFVLPIIIAYSSSLLIIQENEWIMIRKFMVFYIHDLFFIEISGVFIYMSGCLRFVKPFNSKKIINN